MTPDSLPGLAALLDALLDAPPEQRAALIERLSAGDPDRRALLERLRAECEREPALLSRPAAEQFAALLDADEEEFPAALAERYPLTRKLGRGGMATVYLARDVKHGRDVAIKVLDPSLAIALGPKRFLREIEIVAQLHHPHIVPLYDSGDAGGRLYYVMPYEPRGSLRLELERHQGPLPVDQALRILRDVCDAIAHAHTQGIIHRDIKPDNVLLTERHALVADFGVAKALSDATATGMALGTPAYMAPEQIAADPQIDHRADIYAFGVLAYELLTGRPPFTGDGHQDVLSAHLTEPPVSLAARRPDLPEPLAGLVMRCLEKQPADRWQSTAELLERLHALASPATASPSRRRWWPAVAAAIMLVVAAGAIALARDPLAGWSKRWSAAKIERLTDFPGSEVDAAISSDGEWVAFLADRDSVFDAYAGPIASGQFANLTSGRLPQLFNQDVRNVGFSPDGAHAWIRVADITSPASVSLVPVTGGPARPFLATAVMAAWSPDGSTLAYHETTPGDPIYVAGAGGEQPRRVFAGEPGVHSHYVTWSPDRRFVYFAHGLPPDGMDIFRVPAAGGPAEQITHHDSRVAYPVALDDRTLLYTATADDGTGPWLFAIDLNARVPRRLSTGVEHYLSIAASADVTGRPRRLVATVSNPAVELWSVPLTSDVVEEQGASRLDLPTARAAAPRFAADSALFYLATRGGADGIWRRAGGAAVEVWKPAQGPVVGAAAISPDGRRMCFPVRAQGRSTLYCSAADGTAAHAVAESLDVRGAASWSPDGEWIAITAIEGTGLRIFKVPLDGGRAVRLVDSVSFNPVWSPDGRLILYSGTSRARSVPLRAVTADGQPVALAALAVDRVGDSYRFLPNGRQVVVKLGGFRRQDFWLIDLVTGERRQLTRLQPGASVHRFDVSPDGRTLVFERVRENSDVVLIELPPR